MAEPLLEIVKLDVFYGDAQAIWDVSFSVDKGAIVALVGANGAGKTTVLNTISRIIEPRKGKVLWSGRPLAHLKPEEVVALGILHVPEGRRLFSRLSVMENLEMGAFLPKARPLLKESLQKIFTLFPVLKQRMHQAAGSLSGGEQQMLAIGRSLMAKPSLLMLDEPSLGLAPVMVKLMFEIVQVLNREAVTILLVEQNAFMALQIAHRGYVLQTGEIALAGTAKDLQANEEVRKAYLGG